MPASLHSQIDDCDEDRVGPTITLPTLERPPDLWFKTRDEVALHFAQNTLAADDCSKVGRPRGLMGGGEEVMASSRG